nr:uncharacterized protein LOC113822750 [Penaeus vannamei]
MNLTSKVGLHQGSTLSPYIFDLIMDVLSEGIQEEAPWTMLFADDIVLVCKTKESLREKLSQWKRALEDRGLKISRTKSEYLSFNDFEEENGVEMDDEIIKRVPAFKYLGSHVTEDGELDIEVNQRIQSGWQAWRRFSGVLCDKKISARLKGKVYKTAVRPAILYGSETWPIKRVHEKKVNVAEMRMLRWMCGVTRKDKIRNDYIKGTVKVTEVSAKMQERRINWYGKLKPGKTRQEQDARNQRRLLDARVTPSLAGDAAQGVRETQPTLCIGIQTTKCQFRISSTTTQQLNRYQILNSNDSVATTTI